MRFCCIGLGVEGFAAPPQGFLARRCRIVCAFCVNQEPATPPSALEENREQLVMYFCHVELRLSEHAASFIDPEFQGLTENVFKAPLGLLAALTPDEESTPSPGLCGFGGYR